MNLQDRSKSSGCIDLWQYESARPRMEIPKALGSLHCLCRYLIHWTHCRRFNIGSSSSSRTGRARMRQHCPLQEHQPYWYCKEMRALLQIMTTERKSSTKDRWRCTPLIHSSSTT